MFRLRLTIEAQPRSKNGQPPQSTTGVASTNSIQPIARIESKCCKRLAGKHVGHAEKQERERKRDADPESARHGHEFGIFFFVAAAVRGSSAMPQIGHEPGSARTICGCIGQVYSTPVGAIGFSEAFPAASGESCSASNFLAHDSLHKKYVLPARSRFADARAGATFMPQMGSPTALSIADSAFVTLCAPLLAPSSRVRINQFHQFVILRVGIRFAAFAHGLCDAVLQVIAHERLPDGA